MTLFTYACASILNISKPLIYRRMVDILTQAGDDRLLVANQLFTQLWLLALVILLIQVFFRAGDYSIVRSEVGVMKELMNRVFSEMERHSYKFFSDNFSGSLIAKAKRFVGSFEALFDAIVFTVWMTFVNLTSILVVMFFIKPILGFIFLTWLMVYLPIVIWLVRKQIPYDSKAAKENSAVIARFSDVISNILTMKMFSATTREKAKFREQVNQESDAVYRSWIFKNKVFIIQAGFLSVLEVIGMYVALRLWIVGTISSGTIVLVQMYIASIFAQVLHLGRMISRLMKNVADAEEMVEIFELEHDIADPEHPEELRVNKGDILMDNITFRYGESAPVFEGFSFHIQAGEKVGLVGTSGAGKSTITKLLLRFVDPQSGAIRIDGQDIKNIRQDDVRSVIAYVPQDPALFHRTLRENIAYGKPDATEEEIIIAAKKAHAHEFIMQLEKGYETLVGERGVKLSGGERQRVALARAILKDAPILILDEATSSLDTVSEKLIQDALDELMMNKTVMVIAHRLSTIRKMDRIIVLENGSIIEEGNHDGLVASDGAYANLWKHQTDGFIE